MASHVFTNDTDGKPVAIGANERANQYLCLACGKWFKEDDIDSFCRFTLDSPSTDVEEIDYGPVPCPTCNKVGKEPCVRGRYPSPVWDRQEPYPEGHTSRLKANAKATIEGEN